MHICDEIASARNIGVMHCGISSQEAPSVTDLAIEFGLASDPSNYKEIDKTSALRLLELVLKQDMAYNAEIMTADKAMELACRFITQFGEVGVFYYTNIDFLDSTSSWSGISWNPVTGATFDTGVLVKGIQCSGCLWIEDED